MEFNKGSDFNQFILWFIFYYLDTKICFNILVLDRLNYLSDLLSTIFDNSLILFEKT